MSFGIFPKNDITKPDQWEDFKNEVGLMRQLMAMMPGMQPNLANALVRQQPVSQYLQSPNGAQFNQATNRIEYTSPEQFQQFMSTQAIPQAAGTLMQRYATPQPQQAVAPIHQSPMELEQSLGVEAQPPGGTGPPIPDEFIYPANINDQQLNYQQSQVSQQVMTIEAKRIAAQQPLEAFQAKAQATSDELLMAQNEYKFFLNNAGRHPEFYDIQLPVTDPELAAQMGVQPGTLLDFQLTPEEYGEYLQEKVEVLDMTMMLNYQIMALGYGVDPQLPTQDSDLVQKAVAAGIQYMSLADWPRQAIGRRVGGMIAVALATHLIAGVEGPLQLAGYDPDIDWANDVVEAYREGNFSALDDIWENQIAGEAERLGEIPFFGGMMAALTKGALDIAFDPLTWLLMGSFGLNRAAQAGRAAEAYNIARMNTILKQAPKAGLTAKDVAAFGQFGEQASIAGQAAIKAEKGADVLNLIDIGTSLPGMAIFKGARVAGGGAIRLADIPLQRAGLLQGSMADLPKQMIAQIDKEKVSNLTKLIQDSYLGTAGAPSYTGGNQVLQRARVDRLLRDIADDDDVTISSWLPRLFPDETELDNVLGGALDQVQVPRFAPRSILPDGSTVNLGGRMPSYNRALQNADQAAPLRAVLDKRGSRFVVSPRAITDEDGARRFVAAIYDGEDKAVKVFTLQWHSKQGPRWTPVRGGSVPLSKVVTKDVVRERLTNVNDLIGNQAKRHAEYLVDSPKFAAVQGKEIAKTRTKGGQIGAETVRGEVVAVNHKAGVRVVINEDMDLTVEKHIGDGKYQVLDVLPGSRTFSPSALAEPAYHPWFIGASMDEGSFVSQLTPEERATVYGRVGPELEGETGAMMDFRGNLGTDEQFIAEMKLAADIIESAQETRSNIPAWAVRFADDEPQGRAAIEQWAFGTDQPDSVLDVLPASGGNMSRQGRYGKAVTDLDAVKRHLKVDDDEYIEQYVKVTGSWNDPKIKDKRVRNRIMLDNAKYRIEQAYKRDAGLGDLDRNDIDGIIQNAAGRYARTVKPDTLKVTAPPSIARDSLGRDVVPRSRVVIDEYGEPVVDGLTKPQWIELRTQGNLPEEVVEQRIGKTQVVPPPKQPTVSEAVANDEWDEIVRRAQNEEYDEYLTSLANPRDPQSANIPGAKPIRTRVRSLLTRGFRDAPKATDNPVVRLSKSDEFRNDMQDAVESAMTHAERRQYPRPAQRSQGDTYLTFKKFTPEHRPKGPTVLRYTETRENSAEVEALTERLSKLFKRASQRTEDLSGLNPDLIVDEVWLGTPDPNLRYSMREQYAPVEDKIQIMVDSNWLKSASDNDVIETFVHEFGHALQSYHVNRMGGESLMSKYQGQLDTLLNMDLGSLRQEISRASDITAEQYDDILARELYASGFSTLVRDVQSVGDETWNDFLNRIGLGSSPHMDWSRRGAPSKHPEAVQIIQDAFDRGEVQYPPGVKWQQEEIPGYFKGIGAKESVEDAVDEGPAEPNLKGRGGGRKPKDIDKATEKANQDMYKGLDEALAKEELGPSADFSLDEEGFESRVISGRNLGENAESEALRMRATSRTRYVIRSPEGERIELSTRKRAADYGEEVDDYFAPEIQVYQRNWLVDDPVPKVVVPPNPKGIGGRSQSINLGEGLTVRANGNPVSMPSEWRSVSQRKGKKVINRPRKFWTYQDPETGYWYLFDSAESAKAHATNVYVDAPHRELLSKEMPQAVKDYEHEIVDAYRAWDDEAVQKHSDWVSRMAKRDEIMEENRATREQFLEGERSAQRIFNQQESERFATESARESELMGQVLSGPPEQVTLEKQLARNDGRLRKLSDSATRLRRHATEIDTDFANLDPNAPLAPVKNPFRWTVADAWEFTGHISGEERDLLNELIDLPSGQKVTVLDYVRSRLGQGADRFDIENELVELKHLADHPGRLRTISRVIKGLIRDAVMYAPARATMPLTVDAVTDSLHFLGMGDVDSAVRTLVNHGRLMRQMAKMPTFDPVKAAQIQEEIARPARLLVQAFEEETGVQIPRNYSHGALHRLQTAIEEETLKETADDFVYTTMWERMGRGAGRKFDRFSKSGKGAEYGKRAGSFIASGRSKAARTVQDDLKRITGFIQYFTSAEVKMRAEMEAYIYDYAPKMGLDPDEAVNRFRLLDPNHRAVDADAHNMINEYFPGFNPLRASDIEDLFGNTGQAQHLARRWRNMQRQAEDYASKRVDQVMFSYRQTKLDEQIGKFTFFHYWMSRALKLQAAIYFNNPIVQSNVYRAFEGMRRQTEENPEIPAWYKWSVRLVSGPWGALAYMSPEAMLVPFAVAQEMMSVGENPYDQRVADQISNFVFLHPLVQGAITALGFSDSVPDVTGTYATRSIVRQFFNMAKATGWMGEMTPTEDLQERVVRRVLNGLRTGEGAYPGLGGVGGADNRIERPTVDEYEHRRIGYYMIELMREQGIDPESPDADVHWMAWATGNDSDDLYREAYQRFVMEAAMVTGMRMVAPLRYGYEPQEEIGYVAGLGGELMDRDKYGTDALSYAELTPGIKSAMEMRTRTNVGSPEAMQLRLELGGRDDAINATAEIEETYDAYYDYLFEDAESIMVRWNSDMVYIGPDATFTLDEWVTFPQEQKEMLLNQWLWNIGQYQQFEQYRNARQAYTDQSPMLSGYQDYLNDTRANPESTVEMLTDASPSFRDWWNQQDHDPDDPFGRATSMDAYLASRGSAPDIYGDISSSATDISKVPVMDLLRGGGSDEPSFFAKSFDEMTPPERVATLYDEINRYSNNYAKYTAAVEGLVPGQGHLYPYGMTEFGKNWVESQLATMGMTPPTPSSTLKTYMDWVAQQPKGASTTPEDFVAWYGTQQEALLGSSAPNLTPSTEGMRPPLSTAVPTLDQATT